MSERITYQETYRKGAARISTNLLPERLPYFVQGTTLVSMEIRKSGRVEIDGEELEFQDIHVIVRPPKS